MNPAGRGRRRISVVTPARDEAENLSHLRPRLAAALESCAVDWRWIIVDDHSGDRTFDVAAGFSCDDPRVLGVRLARRSGSHAAIACGLALADGDAAVVLAADLQDPPELIPSLLAHWSDGAQVVWAARASGSARAGPLSRLYHALMRRLPGLESLPPGGSDFFLADRAVLDAFRRFGERRTSVLGLIAWMGFRQEVITYEKEARRHGRSGWSARQKLELLLDSLAAFSVVPIRLMSLAGFAIALLGFLYAAFVVVHRLAGASVEGWSSLMVVVLVVGGVQIVMMGILGEYLWRTLEEARGRPRHLIERTTTPIDVGETEPPRK